MTPRRVIGSVDTSEFLVAVAASVGFLFGLGGEAIDARVVAGLLVGGVLAAPVAAWLVRHLPTPVLGAGVGGLLVVTNLRLILEAADVSSGQRVAWYAFVGTAWALLVLVAADRLRRQRAEPADAETHTSEREPSAT